MSKLYDISDICARIFKLRAFLLSRGPHNEVTLLPPCSSLEIPIWDLKILTS